MNPSVEDWADVVAGAIKHALVTRDARIAVLEARLVALETRAVPEPRDGRDGLPGPPGRDGKDGIDGKPGADGLNGKDGRDGANGLDGKDGAPGRDGIDGKNGLDGAIGPAGKDGRDGIDGLNGKDGRDGTLDDAVSFEVAEDQRTVQVRRKDGTILGSWTGRWWIFRGLYRDSTTYTPGDCVSWGGNTYALMGETAVTGLKPIDGATDHPWTKVASKGNDGPRGKDGKHGRDGKDYQLPRQQW